MILDSLKPTFVQIIFSVLQSLSDFDVFIIEKLLARGRNVDAYYFVLYFSNDQYGWKDSDYLTEYAKANRSIVQPDLVARRLFREVQKLRVLQRMTLPEDNFGAMIMDVPSLVQSRRVILFKTLLSNEINYFFSLGNS